MMLNKKNLEKICPMLDRPCLKTGCQIYNKVLDNCEISILTYNLFRLTKHLERESTPAGE